MPLTAFARCEETQSTKDETRRITVNVAKLLELLRSV
jgi:hypothetical protein